MPILRAAVLGAVVVVAVVLQNTVLAQLAVNGVMPNLVLLVVVATTLSRGVVTGAITGFAGGLLLDLAPPADHLAGQWALALVVVAALTSRVRQDTRSDQPIAPLAVVLIVAACSFVATSLFALTGLVLGAHSAPAGELVQVIAIALVWDVVLAPLLVPPLVALLDRTRPGREPEPAY